MRNSYKERDSNQRQEELAIRADNELQWHTDKKQGVSFRNNQALGMGTAENVI